MNRSGFFGAPDTHWTQTFKNLFKKQTNKTSVKNLRMTGGSSFPFDKQINTVVKARLF